ncbi:DNA alkylation repair protein [bacterium]|nr:DNA alkylation repair protein [bacterium]
MHHSAGFKKHPEREEEFFKTAVFAFIACLAWHDKKAPDEKFINLIPVIQKAATNPLNYIMKAVSWSLRHISKRNRNLIKVAIENSKRNIKNGFKNSRVDRFSRDLGYYKGINPKPV